MYFTNVLTLEELKKLYRALAMKNHPDVGGDVEIMKAINNEYKKAFNAIKNAHNATATKETTINETPEEFRDVLQQLIHLVEIDIEICGSWIWISGSTFIYRDQLKAACCKWASKKQMWYWHSESDAMPHNKKTLSIEGIRTKYGSEKIKSSLVYGLN